MYESDQRFNEGMNVDSLAAVKHLALSLDDVQLDALAVLLDSTDWTDELRTKLYDGLMVAGRRADAEHLTDPYSEGARA